MRDSLTVIMVAVASLSATVTIFGGHLLPTSGTLAGAGIAIGAAVAAWILRGTR